MYKRSINILKTRSFFLFGARGTGKSTLMRTLFSNKESFWFDFLDPELERRMSAHPSQFSQELDKIYENKNIKWIILDEVQKVPELLDLVHQELSNKKRFHFALMGSSARKLKRGASNLLAGRALENHLFPLSTSELKSSFHLEQILRWGSLPEAVQLEEQERNEYLKAYAQTYLKEEILVEQLVRNIKPFRSFLEVSAQCSGQIINYSNIARDVESDPVSVKSYFQILEDTLLGFHLEAYHRSIRKRQRQNPKFYLFDLGVKRALERKLTIDLEPGTSQYGMAFEHWIIQEIYRMNSYFRKDWKLSYLRTKDDAEIDLLIETPGEVTLLIEIKSKSTIHPHDLRTICKIKNDVPNSKGFCLSQDPRPKIVDDIQCLPWEQGLEQLAKQF